LSTCVCTYHGDDTSSRKGGLELGHDGRVEPGQDVDSDLSALGTASVRKRHQLQSAHDQIIRNRPGHSREHLVSSSDLGQEFTLLSVVLSDLFGYGQPAKGRPDLDGKVVVDDVVLVDDPLLDFGLVTFSELELDGGNKVLLLDVGERVVEAVATRSEMVSLKVYVYARRTRIVCQL
jgi:hypothetical protein